MAINPGDTVYDMITQEEVQVLKFEDGLYDLSNGASREYRELWKTGDAPVKRGLFRRKK